QTNGGTSKWSHKTIILSQIDCSWEKIQPVGVSPNYARGFPAKNRESLETFKFSRPFVARPEWYYSDNEKLCQEPDSFEQGLFASHKTSSGNCLRLANLFQMARKAAASNSIGANSTNAR
ncbi:MAG: hypothetical protein QOJ40_1034, partial [Verrucomicrobiota bacterium]